MSFVQHYGIPICFANEGGVARVDSVRHPLLPELEALANRVLGTMCVSSASLP